MSIWGSIKHAGKAAGKAASDAGKAAGNAASDAGKAAGNAVADAGKAAGNAVANTGVATWEATSEEAKAIGVAIESSGLKLTPAIIEGGNTAESWLATGVELTEDGLVEIGTYISQHACDIAVGSSLSAVFAAATLDGEEEASFASLAVICAAEAIDTAVLTTQAKAIAFILSEPIWLIPGVSSAVKDKELLRAVIAFAIFKCCKENPKSTVGTGGQIIVGILLACLTSLICEGALPGGFKPWREANY